ncbi:oxidoreductase [Metarhizium album ARSEF 1941]|uniref:Oxidoreductase n=1 Tax=Metarhizium album (strain ARSEF 1941) TaxID=1081103 RepID=A0A0B2X9Y2_METAS|nr:oxidoreductase [Metarhizium album ARSEF 1941]KHO02131.1 oxidoreductase [Metarhizium album ARSEF 1941]
MPRVLHVQKIGGKPGQVYYPIKLSQVPLPEVGPGQLLVRMDAAALNHKDLFIRRHLYPAISFENPLLADGYGTVVEVGPAVKQRDLLNKPVLINPMLGWESDPVGPERGLVVIIGASSMTKTGCAQDYALVDEDDVVPAPAHLTPAQGAALPLAGLTGWRALVTKSGNAEAGRNVLITGIGGGVALQVLQFAVAMGINVYVTSGDQAKIDKAKRMGAKGGVVYKKDGWERELKSLLPDSRPYIDAVIDGAGGNIISKAAKFLKPGGVISQYGMTVAPKMEWSVQAVLMNIDLRGSTMGSKKEFRDMVAFVSEKKIRPIVSKTVKGLANLDGIEGLFKDMDAGTQFGKLVIEINDHPSPSKL